MRREKRNRMPINFDMFEVERYELQKVASPKNRKRKRIVTMIPHKN